jgi:hypothetical protein
MPDVSYTINGQVQKGSLSQSFSANGITADMATAGVLSVTLELSTTSTQVATTSLGALGLCFARSLATVTTHTVSFGRFDGTTVHDAVRLKAGEAAILRLAPGNYAAQSAVAGSRLLLTIYED